MSYGDIHRLAWFRTTPPGVLGYVGERTLEGRLHRQPALSAEGITTFAGSEPYLVPLTWGDFAPDPAAMPEML